MVETTNTDSSNRDLIISGGQFTHLQCHHTNITINIRSEDIRMFLRLYSDFSYLFADYTFLDHNGRDSRSMRHSCLVSSSVHTINISGMSCCFKFFVHHQSVLMHGFILQIMHLHFIAIPNLRSHIQETFLKCLQYSLLLLTTRWRVV